MSQTVHLDVVSLGVPTDADMLIAVSGNNEFFAGGEEESIEGGGMSENECPAGRIFV